MKLLLIVCVLALAATPGQAQSPGSFRVLDKINGILEKELNVLNGDSSQMSSQIALRGTSMNFLKVGGESWKAFKVSAENKYNQLKQDKADAGLKWDELKAKGNAKFDAAIAAAKDDFKGGMVWAKGKLDKNPYKWMAFKVGASLITTIVCPPCALALAVSFAVVDTMAKLYDMKTAISALPAGLSDEAKAACTAAAAASTLIMITATAVNIFVPIPLDAGGAAGAAVAAVFGEIDFSGLVDGVAEASKGTLAAMGTYVKNVIGGAAGEVGNGAADKMLKKLQDYSIAKVKAGKPGVGMANFKCDEVKKLDDEPADNDNDTPSMEDGFF